MITFEYVSVVAPPAYDDFLITLKQYGSTGWRFVVVYNGYVFFERRTKTKVS